MDFDFFNFFLFRFFSLSTGVGVHLFIQERIRQYMSSILFYKKEGIGRPGVKNQESRV